LDIGVECQKEVGGEFEHVFTIHTAENDFVGKVEITDDFKLILNINTFKVNIDKVTDSRIGKINVTLFKALISLFDGILKTSINLIFSRGISLKFIFNIIGIDFIDFEKALLTPFDEYFILYLTPIFKISNIDGLLADLGDISGLVLNELYNNFSNVVIDDKKGEIHGFNNQSKYGPSMTDELLANDSITYVN